MSKYYNRSTGELTSEAPWGNHYYDDDLKATLFANWSEVEDSYVPPLFYSYTDFGTTLSISSTNQGTSSVFFRELPTTSQLSAAFPSVASKRTLAVTTNGVAGDTITMFSTTVTLGTDITVGSTIAETVVNLVKYMNEQERLLGNYRLTSADNTFTLTERFAGGGLDVPIPTVTGTMVISAGTLTESVWGYTTQVKHNAKVALEASAETIREEYRKNYIGAMAAGNTTLASSILTDISSLNASLYTAMQKINDEE